MIVVYTVIFSAGDGQPPAGRTPALRLQHLPVRRRADLGPFRRDHDAQPDVFIENANLIKKLQFPRLCLPIIVVLNAGVNFAIIFGLFTTFLVLSGNFPAGYSWPSSRCCWCRSCSRSAWA
jgi:lipopolysaccharide transport system permease protein